MFKVTIIIPISNAEEYCEESFESLLNQTIGFDNLQVIFVNSTRTNISETYCARYPNVISIDIAENNPKGKLQNIGIKHAVGEYLMFLNPSDIIMDNACESLYDGASKDDYDLICGICNMDEITGENYLEVNSIEECPSILKHLNLNDKLIKKSFIVKNSLEFSEGRSQSNAGFLFDAFLNANKIKLLNELIIKPTENLQERPKEVIDETFEMICIYDSIDNADLFIDEILFDRLNHFTELLKSDLAAHDLLNVIKQSKPLFDLLKQKKNLNYDELNPLFKYIPEERYEDIFHFIYGDVPKQNEITVIALCDSYTYESFKFECNLINLNKDNWLEHFESENPDMFLMTSKYFKNDDEVPLREVLKHCLENKIPTVFWENDEFDLTNINSIILDFDCVFTISRKRVSYYLENGHDNAHHLMFATQPKLSNPISGTSEDSETLKNNMHDVLKNPTYSKRFTQILDALNLKYIPPVKQITLFYKLNNLNELMPIYNHFDSINYLYKQIRIIADEDMLYLPNTILNTQLKDIELGENEYFCFADLNLNTDFVEEALLHFNYIEKNFGIKEDINKQFIFDETEVIENVIFNSSNFKKVILNKDSRFDIYCLSNSMVKVSVVVPIYNAEKDLKECMDRIIYQTLNDIEIICVNNGSYDNSLDMLKEYAKRDSRIKIITQINNGTGSARNAGLKLAKGKYVYFCDCDILLELNGIKEMYQQAELKNLDLLKFNVNNCEVEMDYGFLTEADDNVFDYETSGYNLYALPPHMHSSFFRTELIKDMEFPENISFDENVFFIESMFNSKRTYYYNKALASKKEKIDSATEFPGRNFKDIIEISNRIVDVAKEYSHYEGHEFEIYSMKYALIKSLFLKTSENYKKKFFERIKEDSINKKEEYEAENIFEILDENSRKIFNASLNSDNHGKFEEIIKS